MRTTTTMFISLLLATAAMAERAALIDHNDEWNLFSKFEGGVSDIDESSAFMGGITVGGLLNDQLALGIGAHTVLDSVETQSPSLQPIQNTDFWYGGAYIEYVFSPESLVYLSIDCLVGGGRLEIKDTANFENQANVFVVEPGLNVMINITETFMLGLGASYRFVDNVDIAGLDDDALSNWSGNLFLRFTEF